MVQELRTAQVRRRHLVELEDLPWWPQTFRDATTDYLETVVRTILPYYRPIVPRLVAALRRCSTTEILDLCSGGGGPWPMLLPALRREGLPVTVRLSDRFPNITAFKQLSEQVPGVEFESTPVDATDVPGHLEGFRTIFAGFHHFPPETACAILSAAVRDRRGIAMVEFTARSLKAILFMLMTPAGVWLLTPAIRPFRWSRLFWTYVLPVIPMCVLFDGVISCLRTYTLDELRDFSAKIGAGGDFAWEIGSECVGVSPVPVTYLIGVPK